MNKQLFVNKAVYILERVVNSDCALFMLLLELMFLPLYFQSSISYTDTFSVWSIPCTLLLSDLALKAPTIQKRILYGSICGILLAVGAQIKVTVIIVAIALVIQFIVTKTFKQQLLLLGIADACLVVRKRTLCFPLLHRFWRWWDLGCL